MNTTTGARPGTVTHYAAQVRAHLVGMSADQVDDLTDGLEADLADALADVEGTPGVPGAAEQPDLVARFGPPAEYARELRAAAGLPEPDALPRAGGPRAALSRSRERWRRRTERWVAGLQAQPWWPGVRDLGLSVRPLWWLLRAWVVYQVLMQTLTSGWGRVGWAPTNLLTLLLFAGVLLVSVQWGRGLWTPRRMHLLPRAVGVGALVLLLPALVWAGNASQQVTYAYAEEYGQEDGVWVEGQQVSNLFVYDAEGNPLQDVQIFDDRGRAVETVTDGWWQSWSLPGVTQPWSFVPATDEDERDRWNVYPLRGAPDEEFGDVYSGDAEPWTTLVGEPRTPPLPFAKAPALVEREEAGTTTEAPGAGSAATAAPSTGPSPSTGPPPAPDADTTDDPAADPATGPVDAGASAEPPATPAP